MQIKTVSLQMGRVTQFTSLRFTSTGTKMTEILSNKALEKAILDGETTIKITSKRILTACIMAERCGFDKANIGQFINLVQAAQHDWYVRKTPDYVIGLLNDKGKPYRTHVNLTVLANTLRIIQLMDGLHARVHMHQDDNGNYTGEADITTFV